MDLFLVKLGISIIAVLILTYVAERFGPKTGGIAAALPIGTAIILFIVSLDQGTNFASQSALYNILGMVAVQIFLIIYCIVGQKTKKYSFIIASITATISYFISMIILRTIAADILVILLLPLITTPLMYLILKRTPHTTITKREKYTLPTIVFRVAIATTIIFFIAGLAPAIGPEYLGLLSSFPTTLFPLMIILATTYGIEHTYTIARNFPKGHLSIYFYSLTIWLTYPVYGNLVGTILAYTIATIYLILFFGIKKLKKIIITSNLWHET